MQSKRNITISFHNNTFHNFIIHYIHIGQAAFHKSLLCDHHCIKKMLLNFATIKYIYCENLHLYNVLSIFDFNLTYNYIISKVKYCIIINYNIASSQTYVVGFPAPNLYTKLLVIFDFFEILLEPLF